MQVDLFLRDINAEFPKKVLRERAQKKRDNFNIFTSQGQAYWDGEWKGQYYYPVRNQFPKNASDIDSKIKGWVCREEDDGYLFFDPSTNAVYKGDYDFFEFVQLVKKGLGINDVVSILGTSLEQIEKVLKNI